MELTATQLEFIKEIHSQVRKFQVAQCAWREGGYKHYVFAREAAHLEEDIKNLFKAVIREWLRAKGLTAFIRSELRVRGNYPEYTNYWVGLGYTSIHNGKGGLPDGKNRWLNKITVSTHRGTTCLVAHVARTDPGFLKPTATEFEALIQAIVTALAK